MTGRPSPDEVLGIEDLDITVHDGAATAVRGVSLSVRTGEIVGLVGESGSGKTLTCRAALGVLPQGCAVGRGAISFGGENVTGLSRRGWERLHGTSVGAVFQDPASYLNPNLTVGGQVAEVLRVKQRMPRRQARRVAVELLRSVGLHHPDRVFHQVPAELSGGMLQRVMIAIAISCGPRLLVADEATTALDVTIQAEIIERPRHPYTQALLRVASVGDFRRRELRVIPGQPPPVGADITGCRFAARCPAAIEACRSAPVGLVPLAPGHQARCVRAGDPELAAVTGAAVAGAVVTGAARTEAGAAELVVR